MKTLPLAACAALVLVASGCGLGTGGVEAQGDVSQGKQLFLHGENGKAACAACHTLAEAGAPGQESDIILGVLVPAGTPHDVVDRLHREIVRIVALPDVRERLSALGFESIASTPEEFADRIRWEIDKWAKVIRAANIKAQ